ncbi:hypothetical protein C8R45DRAFT_947788 [Mycena sanguinolenta]|nr:hypothetical protein C8R45DRAFT_947788 [Mycena sanguinolenta]
MSSIGVFVTATSINQYRIDSRPLMGHYDGEAPSQHENVQESKFPSSQVNGYNILSKNCEDRPSVAIKGRFRLGYATYSAICLLCAAQVILHGGSWIPRWWSNGQLFKNNVEIFGNIAPELRKDKARLINFHSIAGATETMIATRVDIEIELKVNSIGCGITGRSKIKLTFVERLHGRRPYGQAHALQNKRDQWKAASARYYERHPEVKEKKRVRAAERRAAKKLARRRWDPPKKTRPRKYTEDDEASGAGESLVLVAEFCGKATRCRTWWPLQTSGPGSRPNTIAPMTKGTVNDWECNNHMYGVANFLKFQVRR